MLLYTMAEHLSSVFSKKVKAALYGSIFGRLCAKENGGFARCCLKFAEALDISGDFWYTIENTRNLFHNRRNFT